MKVTRRIHPLWQGFQEIAEKHPGLMSPLITQMFGKYHYTYESNKGKVSLIKLNDLLYSRSPWEIYSQDTLFDDVERYSTKKEAEVRIKELLG